MVVKFAVRRKDYLTSNLPYQVRLSNVEKQKYDMLMMWIMNNIDSHHCRIPEYHSTGSITFQFLHETHYTQFKELSEKN